MDQHAGALDMAQELMSQTHALGRALDKSRDIRDDKAASALQIHDAQVRRQRREMIIGNLGLGVRHPGKQGGFSHVREAHQSHVRDDLQLQQHLQLLSRLTRLGVFGHLHGGRGKMLVAGSAPAAL